MQKKLVFSTTNISYCLLFHGTIIILLIVVIFLCRVGRSWLEQKVSSLRFSFLMGVWCNTPLGRLPNNQGSQGSLLSPNRVDCIKWCTITVWCISWCAMGWSHPYERSWVSCNTVQQSFHLWLRIWYVYLVFTEVTCKYVHLCDICDWECDISCISRSNM